MDPVLAYTMKMYDRKTKTIPFFIFQATDFDPNLIATYELPSVNTPPRTPRITRIRSMILKPTFLS